MTTYTILVTANAGPALSAAGALRSAFGGVQQSAQGASGSIRNAFDSATGGAQKLLLLLGGLSAAFASFSLAAIIKEGFRFNALLETTKLSIASLVAAFDRVESRPVAEKLRIGLSVAQDQLKKLRVDALATSATFEELASGFQVAIGAGLSKGLNLDQIRTLTLQIGQAAKIFNLQSNQIVSEVRDILSGNITRNSTIATSLEIRREDIQKFKDNADELFKYLQGKLGAFRQAGVLAADTFSGVLSNAQEAFTTFAATATERTFGETRKRLAGILGSVFDVKNSGLERDLQGVVDLFDRIGVAVVGSLGDGLDFAVARLKEFGRLLGENPNFVNQVVAQFKTLVVALTGVATALGIFSLSLLAIEATAVPRAIVAITGLISNVRLLGQVMAGTASLVQGSAATITAATLGWAALAVGIAAVAYAVYSFVTAEREFSSTSVETIRQTIEKEKQFRELSAAVTDYAEKTEGCAGTLIDLKSAYEALSPAAQARVSAIRGESERMAALVDEINKARAAASDLVQLQGINTLGSFGQAVEKQNQALKERTELLEAFNKEEARRKAGTDTLFGINVVDFNQKNLLESSNQASAAYQEQQRRIDELIPRVLEYQKLTGLSDDQILRLVKTYAVLGDDAIPRVQAAIENFRKTQVNAANGTLSLTEQIRKQIGELEKLDAAERQSERRKIIGTAVARIAEESPDLSTARKKLAEQRKGELGKQVEDARRVSQIAKTLEDSLDLDPKKTKAIATATDQIRQFTNEITKSKREIDALKAGGGQIFDLTLRKEDAIEEKRRLEEILKLRRALGVIDQEALPATRSGQEFLLRNLQREDELRKNVLKLSEEQVDAQARLRLAYAASAATVVDAQTKADTAFLEGLRKRREAYADTVADLANLIRRQRDAEKGLTDDLIQAQVSVVRENLNAGAETRRAGFEAVARTLLAQGDTFKDNPAIQQALAIANRPPQVSPVVQRIEQTNALLGEIKLLVSNFSGRPGDGATALPFTGGRNRSSGNRRIDAAVDQFSSQYGVDPNLAIELIRRESGFNQGAVSNKGAIGLTQLLPGTAAGLGVNPRNLEDNIRGGIKYLAQLLAQFEGDVQLALAGYNAGPGRALKALRSFKETRAYVRDITGRLGGGAAAAPQAGEPGFYERAFNFGRQALGSVGSYFSNLFSGASSASSGSQNDNPAAQAAARRQLFGAIGLSTNGTNAEINARAAKLEATPDGRRQLDDAAAILNNRTRLLSIEQQIAELRAGRGAAAAKAISDSETARGEALKASLESAQEAERRLALIRSGDPQTVETIRNNANAAITGNQEQTAQRIIAIQEEIARSGEGAADRMRLAYFESTRARQLAEENAATNIIRTQVELADKYTYSQTQTTAAILDNINRGTKSLSQISADFQTGVLDAIVGQAGTLIDKFTSKLGFLGGVVGNLLKDLAKLALNKIFLSLLGLNGQGGGAGGSGGGLGGFFGSLLGGKGGVTGTPSFAGGAGAAGGGLGGAIGALLGLGKVQGTPTFAGGGGGAGGGVLGALLGGGKGVGGLLEKLTGGAGGLGDFKNTADPSSTITGSIGGLAGKIIGGALSKTIGGAAGSLLKPGAFGGKFAGLGGLAPLLGLQVGGQIGGTLGSIGGLLLGGSLFAGLAGSAGIGSILGGFGIATGAGTLGGGIAAGAAAFLTNPFTIAIGAALLIGGFFLSRAKQRKRDEVERDRILGDVNKQLDSLLDGVKRNKIDGKSAVEQTVNIRAQYIQAINALKTESVRKSAIRNQLPGVDRKIADIKAAAERQDRAREVAENLIPEFNQGGSIWARLAGGSAVGSIRPTSYASDFFRKESGLITRGRGWPVDDVPILAAKDEAVINPVHIAKLGGPKAMRRAGVPGFAAGGAIDPSVGAGAGGMSFEGLTILLNINNVTTDEQAGKIIKAALRDPYGLDHTVNVIVNELKER